MLGSVTRCRVPVGESGLLRPMQASAVVLPEVSPGLSQDIPGPPPHLPHLPMTFPGLSRNSAGLVPEFPPQVFSRHGFFQEEQHYCENRFSLFFLPDLGAPRYILFFQGMFLLFWGILGYFCSSRYSGRLFLLFLGVLWYSLLFQVFGSLLLPIPGHFFCFQRRPWETLRIFFRPPAIPVVGKHVLLRLLGTTEKTFSLPFFGPGTPGTAFIVLIELQFVVFFLLWKLPVCVQHSDGQCEHTLRLPDSFLACCALSDLRFSFVTMSVAQVKTTARVSPILVAELA